MRTIPMLLLLTALTAGCASGPDLHGMPLEPLALSTSTSIRASASVIADEGAEVVGEPQDGAGRDAKPAADKTKFPAKVTAAIRQTGRVIKCGAIGAVAGLVLIPVALAVTTGPASGVSVNPASWAAFALIGIAGGVALAYKDDGKSPCG